MKKNTILIFVMQAAEKINIIASHYIIDTTDYLSMEGTATPNKLDIAASRGLLRIIEKGESNLIPLRFKEITVTIYGIPFA